jgi:outer membrane protein TolC
VLLAVVALTGLAFGPRPAPAQTPVLDDLVDTALQSNLALQQEKRSLDRARAALAEARGRFLPSLDAQARYTRASGGRTIDFPVGDLLNPVYSTLNDLTQQGAFSQIENQEIAFLREREQETSLRLSQPVFAPGLLYGARAQRHGRDAQAAAVDALRRELVRDVQVAYFRYRQAGHRVDALDAARTLVVENRRTSRRLVDADKATEEIVFRAEAEVLAVEQQLADARAQRRRAQSYLNFLLNRSLDTPIPEPAASPADLVNRRLADVLGSVDLATDPPPDLTTVPDTTLPDTTLPDTAEAGPPPDDALDAMQDRAQARRPELDRLSAAVRSAEAERRAAQTAYLPTVSIAVEGGIQGETYGFDGDKPFALASVVLRWNLFNGFSDRARVDQARAATRRLELQRAETERRIDLQVQQALDDVRVARRALATAQARLRAARSSFRLTNRRYEVGRASQVEFTDARTTLTEAEVNLAVTRADLLARLADLEFAAGLYPLARTAR